MASISLQEKANFTRLSRLLVDKGTQALRNTLDAIHAPPNLPAVLNANKTTLLKLKPRVINDTQWDLLFPPSGNPPDSKTFDVTLLTVLLRNLSGFPPPATGWNTMPPGTDTSPQANITRIKLFRNQVYGHVTSTEVDKTTFHNLWQEISKALVGLKIPQKEIDDLKKCPLGPEEEIYWQLLKEWKLKDEECKDMLDDLTRNVNLIHNQVTQSALQQKDDVQLLRQMIEQNQQGIQQLCASSSSEFQLPRPTYDFENSKVGEKNLLQKLAKHNFKSKKKRKVNFFHPGTREWLLKQVDSWFADEDESRLLLLTAGPGFGKSVFAAKVCEIFEDKGKLAACHFCDFSNSNLKDPMMMLQSLASHMCQSVNGFKEKLLDQLQRPHKVHSLKDAFQVYLQNPLDELEVERSLIVIDGLDESATDDKSDMVKLIADNFPDLPRCVKVLVTSRPELSLLGLDDVQKIKIDVDVVDNELDILKYLNVCLPTLATRDKMNHSEQDNYFDDSYFYNSVLSAIVEKCEGSFLYAFHVQHELCKRDDLDTMTLQDIMDFLPEGMGSVYHAYFHRLEIELEAVMKRNPDLFKLLELLVATDTYKALPLKFIARALDLALDCRETKKIINNVNEAVSCLLYVSNDLVTIFHKSVYDWLLANGYDDHEYTVKVSDGKKRLWLVCELVFKEIKTNVCLGQDLKLTNDVEHALQYGYEYLLACCMKESFSWFVDMIIVHVLLTAHPKSIRHLRLVLRKVILRSDLTLTVQLRQRISWHLTEMSYLECHDIVIRSEHNKSAKPFSYLENVLDYSPEGCFTDDEKKIAEIILAKSARCVKRNSVGMKFLKPLFTNYFSSPIVAFGVSSSKKFAAIALNDGTICVLCLPELIELWQYSTEYKCISCCTFAPDDTYVLYGKLETVLDVGQRKETTFFSGEVERFKCCAFSPNGKRLLTNDGSDTLKLWDVVRRSLVSVLSAGAPVDICTFTNTGLFIVGRTELMNEDAYCVWNSVTLQRVDQRSSFSNSERIKKDGVLKSERCNRCFRQECKELFPSKEFGIMPSMSLNPYYPFIFSTSAPTTKCSEISTGIYKEVDCIFFLDKQESLRTIERIHFTTLAAWEIFIENPRVGMKEVPFVHIAAIEDDHWLYGDKLKLVFFSSTPAKENQSSLSRPTCVLWCSFSPDGTRLATCTSDGFVNLWNVETSQVYQRFRSNRETSSAACWWSHKYMFVCHVIDTIPSLLRYPVDASLKIIITERKPVPLFSVNHLFSLFSGFLDFSEGYLSFECGETEPVKVLDIKKIGKPIKVILPRIRPMMSIAVSSRADFVLAASNGYFLWKKNKTQPSVYYVFRSAFSEYEINPFEIFGTHMRYECCFSNDSKFALVSYVSQERRFFVIDVDTGIKVTDKIQSRETPVSSHGIAKIFCPDTVVILLNPNVLQIFNLENWKCLESSFQRYLAEGLLIHSQLSPKGTVLAIPRLTGEMEFLHLRIPKHSSVSNGRGNCERVGGVKRSSSPGPGSFGNIPNVRKTGKETLPGPGRFGNIPNVRKTVGDGKLRNMQKRRKTAITWTW